MAKALIALVALLSLAGTALCTYTHYGKGYNHPSEQFAAQFIKPYITTTTNDIGSDVVAIGITMTEGFRLNAASLPMQTMQIPTPNKDAPFNFVGLEIPLFFPEESTIPYSFISVTYAHSGYPTPGNTPSFIGVYDVPSWSVRFHVKNQTNRDWYRTWRPTAMGPCMGLSADVFSMTMQPVAANCYPAPTTATADRASYANVGDAIFGMGTRLINLKSPEWSPNPGRTFNNTFMYGQFNGTIAHLNALVSDAYLTSQTRDAMCTPILQAPKAFPVDMLMPDFFCTKRVNGLTTVVELKSARGLLRKIPKGDCTISASNPPALSSFYPTSYFSPNLQDASCKIPTLGQLPGPITASPSPSTPSPSPSTPRPSPSPSTPSPSPSGNVTNMTNMTSPSPSGNVTSPSPSGNMTSPSPSSNMTSPSSNSTNSTR